MAEHLNVASVKPITLIVRETDIDSVTRAQLESLTRGVRVLANDDNVRALCDALPTAIARRVRAIVPQDFVLSEIEMTLSVEGKLWGTGLSGDVKVKLAPK